MLLLLLLLHSLCWVKPNMDMILVHAGAGGGVAAAPLMGLQLACAGCAQHTAMQAVHVTP